MALDISFLDSRQLNETDISRPVRNIFRTAGVMADDLGVLGDQLRVREAGTPDMTVDVLAGYGIWFASDGKTVRVFESDATESVAITTASHAGTDTRRDIIIARHTSGTISVVAVAGVPATTGSAVPPAVPSDSLLLAEVAVVGGDTSITNAKITDRRAEAQIFASNTFSGWNICPGPLPTRTATDTIGGSNGQNTTYVATLTFSGIDISGIMTEGVRIRYSQAGSTKYAIVMANSTLSGGNTIVNIFGGTDFQCLDTSSNPITNVSISRDKCPAGFPMDPGKWNIVFKNSSTLERTTNDWGAVANFILAAGNWNMYASGQLHTSRAVGRTRTAVTISKINNTEDDPDLTSMIRLESGGDLSIPFHTQKNVLVQEKTTFHINLWAQDSSTTSQLQGWGKSTIISIYPVSI